MRIPDNTLGIILCVDDDGRVRNGRVFTDSNAARGYCADAVIWLRDPTRADREAVIPALRCNGGIERTAFDF